jgi:hypothetical protein
MYDLRSTFRHLQFLSFVLRPQSGRPPDDADLNDIDALTEMVTPGVVSIFMMWRSVLTRSRCCC